MKLGRNLVLLSKQKQLSISKIARLAGVPIQTIHGWSIGRTGVNLTHLKKIASVLEVSIHELVFGELDPFQIPDEKPIHRLHVDHVQILVYQLRKSE